MLKPFFPQAASLVMPLVFAGLTQTGMAQQQPQNKKQAFADAAHHQESAYKMHVLTAGVAWSEIVNSPHGRLPVGTVHASYAFLFPLAKMPLSLGPFIQTRVFFGQEKGGNPDDFMVERSPNDPHRFDVLCEMQSTNAVGVTGEYVLMRNKENGQPFVVASAGAGFGIAAVKTYESSKKQQRKILEMATAFTEVKTHVGNNGSVHVGMNGLAPLKAGMANHINNFYAGVEWTLRARHP